MLKDNETGERYDAEHMLQGIMEEALRAQEEEQRKVVAMTPEQLAAYRIEQGKCREESEQLLNQLRGSGFAELSVMLKRD